MVGEANRAPMVLVDLCIGSLEAPPGDSREQRGEGAPTDEGDAGGWIEPPQLQNRRKKNRDRLPKAQPGRPPIPEEKVKPTWPGNCHLGLAAPAIFSLQLSLSPPGLVALSSMPLNEPTNPHHLQLRESVPQLPSEHRANPVSRGSGP